MPKAVKNIITGLLILAASVLCGFILIVAVYSIPVSRIREHVEQSSVIFDEEGLVSSYIPWLTSTRRDNYTDSIMLSMAAHSGSGSVLDNAMESRYIYVEDSDLYDKDGYLLHMLDASEDGSSVEVEYSRYWHGYLVFVKPLLLLMNYGGIRIVNAIVQVIMLGFVLLRMVHHPKAKKMVIPLLIAVFAINPVSTVINMQYACIYNITMLSLLLMFNTKFFDENNYWKAFLVIGISVAYFDFLTYPLVSLGFPLVMMLVIREDTSTGNLKTAAVSCVNWGLGYALMWASKWVLCYVITGRNTITDALGQIKERTVTNAYAETGISSDNIIDVIGYNIEAFRDWLSFAVFAGAIVAFILYIVIGKKKFKTDESSLIPLLLIAMIPFVWYAVLSNHSAIHFWMTYRNLTVTIMAVAAILMSAVSTSAPAVKE